MSSLSTPDAIAALTVTYEPDAGWPDRLRAILRVCPRCIVVDNSVTPEARTRVSTTVAGLAGAELIANPDNPGIGRALNQGCRALRAAGCAWVVAFDQDSTPPSDLAGALLATAASRTASRPVAVVGANWHDLSRPDHPSRHLRAAVPFGWGFRRDAATQDLADVLCVITSGALISLKVWDELGGFDENLFLDLVDTDYCLRARQAGWAVAVSAAARLAHQRGAKRPVRCLGRVFYPAFMPPSRLHNLWRNRLWLFRRYGWREPAWVAYEMVYALKLLSDILFLENHKAAKLAACVRGTWDGLAKRPPSAPARRESK